MKYTTHISTGAYLGAMIVTIVKPEPIVATVFMTASIFGSLLPDIDHPKSWLGQRMPIISIPISAIFGHRGITHSLLGSMILITFTFIVNTFAPILSPLTVGILVGYLSHILGDWLTPSGIPLLWPNKERYASPAMFELGGIHETILFFVLTVTSIYMFSSYVSNAL